MISEDCQPWLIEINASPDLGATTSVTARLCPQCLEDVIKGMENFIFLYKNFLFPIKIFSYLFPI